MKYVVLCRNNKADGSNNFFSFESLEEANDCADKAKKSYMYVFVRELNKPITY